MNITKSHFNTLSLSDKIQLLYREGVFVMAIRYYKHKVNLYLLSNFYVEVFYNHKLDKIEMVEILNDKHTRMKFYADQVHLPSFNL